MLARGEKKLDRGRHDLDWQRQVYKIDVELFPTSNYFNFSPITIDTTKIPSLLLVTGGGVTEASSAFINSTAGGPLALGVVAGNSVSLGGANQVGTLAGFVDGAARYRQYRGEPE